MKYVLWNYFRLLTHLQLLFHLTNFSSMIERRNNQIMVNFKSNVNSWITDIALFKKTTSTSYIYILCFIKVKQRCLILKWISIIFWKIIKRYVIVQKSTFRLELDLYVLEKRMGSIILNNIQISEEDFQSNFLFRDSPISCNNMSAKIHSQHHQLKFQNIKTIGNLPQFEIKEF